MSTRARNQFRRAACYGLPKERIEGSSTSEQNATVMWR